MNTSMLYIQSGVIFALLTVVFICLTAEMLLKTGWLMIISFLPAVSAVIYAIISSIKPASKD